MFTDETARKFFTDEMILVKINALEDTAASNRYHARAFPTSLLIGRNGDEIDRIVGYDTTDVYLQTLRDYTNGIGTLADLLGRAKTEEDRSLYLEIADKYKYRGDVGGAVTWFDRVIEAGEPRDSLSGEARMSLAYMLRKAEKYDEALAAFQTIAEEFVDSYHGRDAVIYQAIIYRQKGDTASAISTFENYIERFPESEDVEYARGQIEKLMNPPVDSGK